MVDPVLASPSIMDQPGVLVEEQQERVRWKVEPPEEDVEQNRELVRNYPARIRGPPDRFE